MMKNYDQSVEINHDPNWSYIPDHLYRILIIGGSGSGKANVLKLTQFFINERKKMVIKKLKNPKVFNDYSHEIDDVYEHLEHYNLTKTGRVLTVFDDMVEDIESNKKLSPIVTELFLRGRKLNISLVFISQSDFEVSKTIRLNATYYFIMKIPKKKELQQIAPSHLSGIDFKDFMKFYKDYTKELHSLLVNDTTLSSDNPLRFRKNLL